MGEEVSLCMWCHDKRSAQYADKFSIYCTVLQTCQILSLTHCYILIVCFVVHCFCHMSCAFAPIISPELSWFLRGFLHSRTAMPLAHSILHMHWYHHLRWNARHSHTVSHYDHYSDIRQCWHRSENRFLSIPFCMTTCISKYISTASLKVFIGSWTHHSVDSGSCSW